MRSGVQSAGPGGSGSGAGGGASKEMDIWEAARMCVVKKALEGVPGMKALLLDDVTSKVVSLVCSQSQALSMQVYAVDKLDNERRKPLGGFRGVCFIRSTSDTIRHLRRELSDPKFDSYHLFFTNSLPDHVLKDIAQADKKQVVQQVHEVFVDYIPLGPELCTLNVPTCMDLEPPSWNQPLFDRISDGIVSILLSLKLNPIIAYHKTSQIAQKLASEVEDRVRTGNHTSDVDLFRFGKASKQPPLLLIIDRREDPVTPLLNQWTYTAMLHEILGIHNNRVDVTNIPKCEQDEVVLNAREDSFLRDAEHMEFGELGEALQSVLVALQKEEGSAAPAGGGRANLQSIGDLERFMARYPEFRRQQSAVAMHVALTSELSRAVDDRMLMELSELEQELACTDSLTEAFNKVETMVENAAIRIEDKVRLVMLYNLRYELEGERECRFLERSLRDQLPAESPLLHGVADLKGYAGVGVRSSDIFNKKTVANVAKTLVKRHIEGIKGVSNVLTRHQPVLASCLAGIKASGVASLRHEEFKVLGANTAARPQHIVVFVVGGATYAESRCVSAFNAENAARGMRAVLASNCIHNTESFMKDVLRHHGRNS